MIALAPAELAYQLTRARELRDQARAQALHFMAQRDAETQRAEGFRASLLEVCIAFLEAPDIAEDTKEIVRVIARRARVV